jgi:hypothetical protein
VVNVLIGGRDTLQFDRRQLSLPSSAYGAPTCQQLIVVLDSVPLLLRHARKPTLRQQPQRSTLQ